MSGTTRKAAGGRHVLRPRRADIASRIVRLIALTGALVAAGFAASGRAVTVRADQTQVQRPASGGALDGIRHRVLVSSDIGGTDPDDAQSMVHLLLYADVFDLEGLVSSPYGPGRKAHILDVIDQYERDYPKLRTYSDRYPSPAALRAITKQGETEVAPYEGVRRPTEGAAWIVDRARAADPRPLYVLVWGGLEDLAQALHDAPDILPKLRVHFIGGPNKKWTPDAYQYIVTHHPNLWMIEANSTYRGWFTGGDQSGDQGNDAFVRAHVADRGALGAYFATQLPELKMGDSPTVARLLRGAPEDPAQPGWGGRYVRAWERPYARFDRLTTRADQIELFGILELALPVDAAAPAQVEARMVIENQSLIGQLGSDRRMHFRFSPKDPKVYRYDIRSSASALDGQSGEITAVVPPPARVQAPAKNLPHWWTDDLSPALAEGVHAGARTVSQWRADFLQDFGRRMDRLVRTR